MDAVLSLRPLLAILVSLGAAVLIIACGRRPNLREGWTLLASLLKFGLVASMVPWVLQGRSVEWALPALAPGVALALRVDAAGLLFALSASFLWILTSFYSIGYMRGAHERHQTRFFALLALCLSATMGIAFAANLLTFFLFYEILSFATYFLVVHKGTAKAISSGRKYLAFALLGGLSLLVAVVWTAVLQQGAIDFRPGGFLDAAIGKGTLQALFALFALGFGVKAGVMPLHSWLPAAMVAPTPVSALLHAVAVVKAGVFGFVRLIGFIFGPELLHQTGLFIILAWTAGATIVLASLLAMRQDDLKARLAYSTVGHLSYIVLATALLTPTALLGGAFHIVTHAAMKITLFFCAGAIYVHTGLTRVSQLDGLGRRMPVTMGAFAIGAIGLAGIPGTAGFVSKLLIARGTLEAGQPVFLGILLLSGLLNAGYLFPVVTRAFFRDGPAAGGKGCDEASWLMVGALVVTGGLSLLLGLYPDGLFHFFSVAGRAAGAIVAGGAP